MFTKNSPTKVDDDIQIFVASNQRGQDYRLRLSHGQVRAFFWLSLVGLFLVFILAMDYLQLLDAPPKNKGLRARNQFYKQRLNEVRSDLSHLQEYLQRARRVANKVAKITNLSERLSLFKLEDYNLSSHEYDYLKDENHGKAHEDSEQPLIGEISPTQSLMIRPVPSDSAAPAKIIEERPSLVVGEELWAQIDKAIDESERLEQRVLGLWETLSAKQDLLEATPSIRPARGWYSSRFGYRIDPVNGRPAMHAGLDIAAPYGRDVYATAKGRVKYVGNHPGYGFVVVLDHGYGVETRYAHNSKVYVTAGQRVSRRETIAAIGNTGRSTGPHLHYEVRVNGIAVDPMNYILDDLQ